MRYGIDNTKKKDRRKRSLQIGDPKGNRTPVKAIGGKPFAVKDLEQNGGDARKQSATLSATLPVNFKSDLQKVIDAWPYIGERGKATILGIARTASRPKAE